MQTVTDPDDPRLDDYRHLSDAAARRAIEGSGGQGVFIVEGAVALEQLLASDHRIRSVVLSPTRADALAERLLGRVEEVLVADRRVLRSVTGFDVHRGVLAAGLRPPPADAHDVLRAARRVVLLEGISDNENIGAVFRNAAALGIDAVVLDQACADPLYRRSIRVSSGWSLRVPSARVSDTATATRLASDLGMRSVALTPGDGALAVDEAAAAGALDDPAMILLGAEGPGLRPESIAAADVAVRVPMAGDVDSLNVATSLAVVASFAAARRGWCR
ncbi:MAG: TrmH family RNA methyltransferase [Microthrixaceae bacterium]